MKTATPNFAKKIGKKSIFSLVVPPPANRVLRLRLHRKHAESAPDSAFRPPVLDSNVCKWYS